MSRNNPADFSRQIARGVEFLDVVKPGWEDMIDTSTLRLSSTSRCVLGQTLEGHYAAGKYLLRDYAPRWARWTLGVDGVAVRYGFQLPARCRNASMAYWSALTEQWVFVINARRAETERALPESAPEPVPAPAPVLVSR